jgi:hypothetical protein
MASVSRHSSAGPPVGGACEYAVAPADSTGRRLNTSNDSSVVGKKNRLKFANRNMYEGIEVQRVVRVKQPARTGTKCSFNTIVCRLMRILVQVRRATQWELSADIDVRANFVVHGKLYRFSPVSLGCLPETSALRQFLVWLVTWKWWDRAVLLIILLNTIMLAMTDYSLAGIDWDTMSPDPTKSSINAFTQAVDPYFTALFTIEAACKIAAMGFLFDEGAYLRDSWNVLDFVVVATSLLQIIPGVPKVSALRAFRVLRPLRTLARLKGMRMMVNSLLSSIPQLANVGILLFFLFLVWAICAVNLFQGGFHARCRVTAAPLSIPSSHLRSWDSSEIPPWIAQNDTHGLWLLDVEQGLASLSDPTLSKFQTSATGGLRRGLYYEMLDRYFSGNDAEDVVYDASVMEHLNTTNSTPWIPSASYYVSFAQSVVYMWNLQHNRSAFPWCGANEPLSLLDPSTGVFPGSGIPLNSADWSQDTSPWQISRDCAWPVDLDDPGVCSTDGTGGYVCQDVEASSTTLPSHVLADSSLATFLIDTREIARTCGSNYDAFGNPRFHDAGIMKQELGTPNLAFGLYGADWIGQVFLTIYQCITLEGWTMIMYWTMDSYQPAVGALYYVLLVLVGSMFLLNLVVASIFLNFNAAQVSELESIRIRREKVASITQAEKQEAHRATAKAKLVSEIRRSASTAKSKLRRVSAGDALWSTSEVPPGTSQTPEIEYPDSLALETVPLVQAHGVLRRRIPTLSSGPSLRQVADTTLGPASKLNASRPLSHGFAQQLERGIEQAGHESHLDSEPLQRSSAGTVRSTYTSVWPGRAASVAGSDALHPPTVDAASVAGTVSSVNSGLLHAVNKRFTVPRHTPCTLRTRLWLLQLFASAAFGVLMLLLIILNTVTLSMDSYPGDQSLAHELEIVNFSLTIAFALEFLGKLLGMGPAAYFRDKFNIFDTIIVALSIVDLGIAQPYFLTGVESRSTSVLALRTLRLSRIFKLARSWTSLRMLLKTIKEAINDVAYFAVLLLLYVLVFSLFGMQLFANKFRFTSRSYEPLLPTDVRYFADDVIIPRSNFDTLWNSFLSMFQIITSENWNDLLLNASVVAGSAGIFFTVAAQAIGGIVLLSLFLAVVLGAFEGLDDLDAVKLPSVAAPEYKVEGSSPRSKSTSLPAVQPSGSGWDASSQLLGVVGSLTGVGTSGATAAKAGTVVSDTRSLRSRQANPSYRAQRALRKVFSWGRNRADSVKSILNALRDAVVMKELLRLRAQVLSVYSGRKPSLPRVFAAARPPGVINSSDAKVSSPMLPRSLNTPATKTRQKVPAMAPLTRLHSMVLTNLTTPAQLYHSESRETASEASWRDRLSSFGAESFSTHGRGTVASAASTQNDDYEDDEERLNVKSSTYESVNILFRAQQTHHMSARGVVSFFCSCCSCLWRPCLGGRGNVASDVKIISRTLFCFDNHHPLRRLCLAVALHPAFENLVLLVILLSSITLAIDSPLLDPDGTLAYILAVCDVLWTAFFTAELVVKVIANGLVFTNNAYLRSGWNCLDMGVVAVSIFTLLTDGNVAYRSLRSLRALRALRPLRVISRNPSLKLVVNALFRALQPIFNVMLVCSLMFLIFAIVATSLFKGATSECTGTIVDLMNEEQFNLIVYPVAFNDLPPYQRAWGFACTDGPYAQQRSTFFGADFVDTMSTFSCPEGYGYGYLNPDNQVPTSKVVCLWFGGTWDRAMPFSFDNVLSSMGVLLEMSTTENWVVILYNTIDARGVDMQPVREYNLGIGAFWIVFMLFGGYFTVNLVSRRPTVLIPSVDYSALCAVCCDDCGRIRKIARATW